MHHNKDSRFDLDLKTGVAAEAWYGAMVGGTKTEVKFDKRATQTGNVFIETYCDKGRKGNYTPSGINVTEAEAWVYALGDNGNGVPTSAITVSTARLKYLVANSPDARQVEMNWGNCPTKGIVLPITTLLTGS